MTNRRQRAATPKNTALNAFGIAGFGLGGGAEHCGQSRWHDDHGLWITVGDRRINTILVVGAIGRERGHGAFHLIQQGTNLGGVIHVFGRKASINNYRFNMMAWA